MDESRDADDAFDGVWKIPHYNGGKITCATCEHHFQAGDPVMVSEKENLVFCSISEDMVSKNCMTQWVFENGKPLMATMMWF